MAWKNDHDFSEDLKEVIVVYFKDHSLILKSTKNLSLRTGVNIYNRLQCAGLALQATSSCGLLLPLGLEGGEQSASPPW
jgi:hypothetical protein